MSGPFKLLDATFRHAAGRPGDFPNWILPEVAFAGRSNVGKSSALRLLTEGRCEVRVSKSPGRTRTINFYEVRTASRPLAFVDLPGYGYAAVSKTRRAAWANLVESYVETRRNLRLVVLLVDLRRGPEAEEQQLVTWLESLGLAWRLVLTKADKLSKNKRLPVAEKAWAALSSLPDASNPKLGGRGPILFSAKTGLGKDELWRAIAKSIESP